VSSKDVPQLAFELRVSPSPDKLEMEEPSVELLLFARLDRLLEDDDFTDPTISLDKDSVLLDLVGLELLELSELLPLLFWESNKDSELP
jgi:hypothetical protein